MANSHTNTNANTNMTANKDTNANTPNAAEVVTETKSASESASEFVSESVPEVKKWKVGAPSLRPIKAPVAGCYPQGLYQYPENLFTQTITWSPAVTHVFEADTAYTAVLTLTPTKDTMTFEGVTLDDVKGLPEEHVIGYTTETIADSMVIHINFAKTAEKPAEPTLLFYDEFDGDTLDTTKWALCPKWDRQGRSTWSDDMVSVTDGYLRLGFVRDEELGQTKTDDEALSKNWLRAGAVRTLSTNHQTVLFDNNYGYYEARIKFPKVRGMWGAFWLMSQTQSILTDAGVIGTEIDIVESIANPTGRFNAALHWDGYGSEHKSVSSGDAAPSGIDIYDGEFHTFALEWAPQGYTFYVDGVVFWQVDGGASFKNCGINQNPNYIKLTVEGAAFAGLLPEDFTEGEMLVDYVRVYDGPISG